MAKQSGIGSRFYVAGYDLSGDVSAVDTLNSGHGLLEVPNLLADAMERLHGRRDGEMSIASWWDTGVGAAHVALSAVPTTDALASLFVGTARGSAVANCWGKQMTYAPKLGDDGSLALSTQVLPNGWGVEWGTALTTAKETIASAANGTGVDLGNADYTPVNIQSNSVANPTVVTTATAHGLVTGDSVTIANHTGSTPAINGDYPVTYISPTTFSIPVNVTVGGGANGTVQKTSTNFGAVMYVQTFSFGSNSGTVKIQTSADNGSADAYADIAGMLSTSQSARVAGERVASTSATAICKRWVRIVTAGTFTNMAVAVAIVRFNAAQS